MSEYKCPECGQTELFRIQLSTTIEVNGNGEEISDSEPAGYDEDSWMKCSDCDHEGIAAEFEIKDQKEVTE